MLAWQVREVLSHGYGQSPRPLCSSSWPTASSLKDSGREASHPSPWEPPGTRALGAACLVWRQGPQLPQVGASQGQRGPERAAHQVSLLDSESSAAVGRSVFLSLL